MGRAWQRLQEFLTKTGIYDEPFLQGSWANGTAVRPARSDGEYDVDVVAPHKSAPDEADAAITELERVLAQDGDYKKRLRPDRPCVRLEYADDETGRFHLDIVVARPAHPIDVALRGRGWKPSDPQGYTDWCTSQGDQFLRVVKMLKRWRDENQPARSSIKSIVLQVLAGQALHGQSFASDAKAVTAALSGIAERLAPHSQSAPALPNPVLPNENLTARWPATDYRQFRDVVAAAAQLAQRGSQETDPTKRHNAWRELFGKDFPAAPSSIRPSSPPPPPGYPKERQQALRQGTDRYA